MTCEMVCTGEALVTLDDLLFFIFVAFIIYMDVYFTRKTWDKIQLIDKTIKFNDFELNKLAVYYINKFGEKWGFRMAFATSFTLYVLLILFINPIFVYFIAGAWMTVFLWHAHNIGKVNGILEEKKMKKNLAMELARKKRKGHSK